MPEHWGLSADRADDLEITPEDIERAKLAWERAAPAECKDLLDAEPVGETAEELDTEGLITPEVEREADEDAERFGSPLLRAMLDATPMPEQPASDE